MIVPTPERGNDLFSSTKKPVLDEPTFKSEVGSIAILFAGIPFHSIPAYRLIPAYVLAGIIVRNSILLIDFTIAQVQSGVELREAVITAAKYRTRPILITALALVLGSAVILTDPTFQGMAISLLFGVFVSTLLTLIVIPLGCVSLGQKLFQCAGVNDAEQCKRYDQDGKLIEDAAATEAKSV